MQIMTWLYELTTVQVTTMCAILLVVLSSCGTPYANYEYKLDPLLRQKIADLEKRDSEEPVGITGKWSRAITEEDRGVISASGVRIMTVAGDIFTASGTWKQVRELSTGDLIVSLELAVERNFNH